MRTILFLLLLPAAVVGEELAPWKSNRHKTDTPRRHVQVIDAGRAEYRVVQRGTI